MAYFVKLTDINRSSQPETLVNMDLVTSMSRIGSYTVIVFAGGGVISAAETLDQIADLMTADMTKGII
jgi:hypothetical protein